MKKKTTITVVAALGLVALLSGVALATSASEPGPAAVNTGDMAALGADGTPTGSAGTGTPTLPTGAGSPTDDRRDDDRGDDDGRGDDDRTPAVGRYDDLIPVAKAIDIARQRVPQGQLDDTELEWEHGRLVWSVEFIANGVEHEVDVDAKTGEVVRVKHDD